MIIRARKDTNYTVINNTVLRDERLTWEAKGMAAYLLSKPDHWCINADQLWRASKNGVGTVKRILRELEEYGYLRRERFLDENNRIQWAQTLYEIPMGRISSDGISSDGISSDGNPSDIVSTVEVSTEEQQQAKAPADPGDILPQTTKPNEPPSEYIRAITDLWGKKTPPPAVRTRIAEYAKRGDLAMFRYALDEAAQHDKVGAWAYVWAILGRPEKEQAEQIDYQMVPSDVWGGGS